MADDVRKTDTIRILPMTPERKTHESYLRALMLGQPLKTLGGTWWMAETFKADTILQTQVSQIGKEILVPLRGKLSSSDIRKIQQSALHAQDKGIKLTLEIYKLCETVCSNMCEQWSEEDLIKDLDLKTKVEVKVIYLDMGLLTCDNRMDIVPALPPGVVQSLKTIENKYWKSFQEKSLWHVDVIILADNPFLANKTMKYAKTLRRTSYRKQKERDKTRYKTYILQPTLVANTSEVKSHLEKAENMCRTKHQTWNPEPVFSTPFQKKSLGKGKNSDTAKKGIAKYMADVASNQPIVISHALVFLKYMYEDADNLRKDATEDISKYARDVHERFVDSHIGEKEEETRKYLTEILWYVILSHEHWHEVLDWIQKTMCAWAQEKVGKEKETARKKHLELARYWAVTARTPEFRHTCFENTKDNVPTCKMIKVDALMDNWVHGGYLKISDAERRWLLEDMGWVGGTLIDEEIGAAGLHSDFHAKRKLTHIPLEILQREFSRIDKDLSATLKSSKPTKCEIYLGGQNALDYFSLSSKMCEHTLVVPASRDSPLYGTNKKVPSCAQEKKKVWYLPHDKVLEMQADFRAILNRDRDTDIIANRGSCHQALVVYRGESEAKPSRQDKFAQYLETVRYFIKAMNNLEQVARQRTSLQEPKAWIVLHQSMQTRTCVSCFSACFSYRLRVAGSDAEIAHEILDTLRPEDVRINGHTIALFFHAYLNQVTRSHCEPLFGLLQNLEDRYRSDEQQVVWSRKIIQTYVEPLCLGPTRCFEIYKIFQRLADALRLYEDGWTKWFSRQWLANTKNVHIDDSYSVIDDVPFRYDQSAWYNSYILARKALYCLDQRCRLVLRLDRGARDMENSEPIEKRRADLKKYGKILEISHHDWKSRKKQKMLKIAQDLVNCDSKTFAKYLKSADAKLVDDSSEEEDNSGSSDCASTAESDKESEESAESDTSHSSKEVADRMASGKDLDHVFPQADVDYEKRILKDFIKNEVMFRANLGVHNLVEIFEEVFMDNASSLLRMDYCIEKYSNPEFLLKTVHERLMKENATDSEKFKILYLAASITYAFRHGDLHHGMQLIRSLITRYQDVEMNPDLERVLSKMQAFIDKLQRSSEAIMNLCDENSFQEKHIILKFLSIVKSSIFKQKIYKNEEETNKNAYDRAKSCHELAVNYDSTQLGKPDQPGKNLTNMLMQRIKGDNDKIEKQWHIEGEIQLPTKSVRNIMRGDEYIQATFSYHMIALANLKNVENYLNKDKELVRKLLIEPTNYEKGIEVGLRKLLHERFEIKSKPPKGETTELKHNGVTYLKDTRGVLYDYKKFKATGEGIVVGKWNKETKSIDPEFPKEFKIKTITVIHRLISQYLVQKDLHEVCPYWEPDLKHYGHRKQSFLETLQPSDLVLPRSSTLLTVRDVVQVGWRRLCGHPLELVFILCYLRFSWEYNDSNLESPKREHLKNNQEEDEILREKSDYSWASCKSFRYAFEPLSEAVENLRHYLEGIRIQHLKFQSSFLGYLRKMGSPNPYCTAFACYLCPDLWPSQMSPFGKIEDKIQGFLGESKKLWAIVGMKDMYIKKFQANDDFGQWIRDKKSIIWAYNWQQPHYGKTQDGENLAINKMMKHMTQMLEKNGKLPTINVIPPEPIWIDEAPKDFKRRKTENWICPVGSKISVEPGTQYIEIKRDGKRIAASESLSQAYFAARLFHEGMPREEIRSLLINEATYDIEEAMPSEIQKPKASDPLQDYEEKNIDKVTESLEKENPHKIATYRAKKERCRELFSALTLQEKACYGKKVTCHLEAFKLYLSDESLKKDLKKAEAYKRKQILENAYKALPVETKNELEKVVSRKTTVPSKYAQLVRLRNVKRDGWFKEKSLHKYFFNYVKTARHKYKIEYSERLVQAWKTQCQTFHDFRDHLCTPREVLNRRAANLFDLRRITIHDNSGVIQRIFRKRCPFPIVIVRRTTGRPLAAAERWDGMTAKKHFGRAETSLQTSKLKYMAQIELQSFGLIFFSINYDSMSILRVYIVESIVSYLVGYWTYLPIFTASNNPWAGNTPYKQLWNNTVEYQNMVNSRLDRIKELYVEEYEKNIKEFTAEFGLDDVSRRRELSSMYITSPGSKYLGIRHILRIDTLRREQYFIDKEVELGRPILADTCEHEFVRKEYEALDKDAKDNIKLKFPTEDVLANFGKSYEEPLGRQFPSNLQEWLVEGSETMRIIRSKDWPLSEERIPGTINRDPKRFFSNEWPTRSCPTHTRKTMQKTHTLLIPNFGIDVKIHTCSYKWHLCTQMNAGWEVGVKNKKQDDCLHEYWEKIKESEEQKGQKINSSQAFILLNQQYGHLYQKKHSPYYEQREDFCKSVPAAASIKTVEKLKKYFVDNSEHFEVTNTYKVSNGFQTRKMINSSRQEDENAQTHYLLGCHTRKGHGDLKIETIDEITQIPEWIDAFSTKKEPNDFLAQVTKETTKQIMNAEPFFDESVEGEKSYVEAEGKNYELIFLGLDKHFSEIGKEEEDKAAKYMKGFYNFYKKKRCTIYFLCTKENARPKTYEALIALFRCFQRDVSDENYDQEKTCVICGIGPTATELCLGAKNISRTPPNYQNVLPGEVYREKEKDKCFLKYEGESVRYIQDFPIQTFWVDENFQEETQKRKEEWLMKYYKQEKHETDEQAIELAAQDILDKIDVYVAEKFQQDGKVQGKNGQGVTAKRRRRK